MKFIYKGFYAVMILFFWTGISKGLECPKCRDLSLESASIPQFLKNLVNSIPGLRVQNCKSGIGDGVETITCPTPTAGSSLINKCAYYKGTIDISYLIGTFPIDSVVRDCIQVNPINERDGCQQHTDVTEDRVVLKEVISALSLVGFVDFKGERCLSTTGVGAGSVLGANIFLIITCFISLLMFIVKQ